ncbi:Uncharacterized protein C16H5.15 [Colletotrichum chlorophyti]|uniref:Uncharacterized protein C16H5.15 n=1 Tax=Colletotrichum chlorophyti TaxID=708187 RepID=A0A1Q8RBK0_9PEZI|nr:Uncharacterized protein C16H5.15 [Colletotrichum chlorophyti]
MAATILSPMQTQLTTPNITSDDLKAFFEAHFSSAALNDFNSDFFNAQTYSNASTTNQSLQHGDFVDEEDDGLGYYSDGVKRTLTDDQIAMFRHSELENLRREQERAAERRSPASHSHLETGEIGEDGSPKAAKSSHQSGKAPKAKKKRRSGKGKPYEPKPDLRKRTWDVVEAGLDTLDYD